MVSVRKFIRRRVVVRALPPGREFPIDMLRYDNCVPATEEDARTIERLGYGYDRGWSGNHSETVTLHRYAAIDDDEVTPETGKLRKNSHDRWRSKFHWEIVEDVLDG